MAVLPITPQAIKPKKQRLWALENYGRGKPVVTPPAEKVSDGAQKGSADAPE